MKALKWLVMGLVTGVGIGVWLAASVRACDEPIVLADKSLIAFEIHTGESWLTVIDHLKTQGIIRDYFDVAGFCILHPHTFRLRTGEYALSANLTLAQLLTQMSQGQVWLHPVTFVEGQTIAVIRHNLNQMVFLDNDLLNLTDEQVLKQLDLPQELSIHSLEGLLAADTFKVPKHTKQSAVIKESVQLNLKRWLSIWQARDPKVDLSSPYEALILASLIERETANSSERGLISSVFYNRLHQHMRLQTDPTVIYAQGEHYDGHLHHADLAIDSPYNTYLHEGLPPTPIGIVGRASLEAAVHPTASPYLYFVASGLGDGRHQFSSNLKEHEQAVKRYIERKEHP